MNINAVIAQLRLYAPLFEARIGGAADFAQGIEGAVWMAEPAAYVIPLDEEAGESESEVGLYQRVNERVGVVVALNNTTDRRGQASAVAFHDLRAQVWRALLNWRPSPATQARGFTYGGGQLRDFDRGRLFYQWEFVIETTVTDDDGWNSDRIPMTEIDVAGFDPETLVQTVDLRVTDLQE